MDLGFAIPGALAATVGLLSGSRSSAPPLCSEASFRPASR